MRKFLLLLPVAVFVFIAAHYFFLKSKAPKERYPDDSFLEMQNNKTALVIVAHDDDAISSAGTISKLCRAGWTVKELCFYHKTDNEELNKRNLQRQKDIEKVKEIEGLKEFKSVTLPYRIITDDSLSYMPVRKAEFGKYYNRDTVLYYIRQFINENKPSVIFTLDNQIGGYGHPDHIFISQLVLDECNSRLNDSSFTVKKIYQAVLNVSVCEFLFPHRP